jgi:hypothetical protein
MEYCPDQMERAHRAGLPGEKMIECDRCGKLIMESESHSAPTKLPLISIYHLFNPSLVCDQCLKELEKEQ